ncbi:MAG TPA: hypothetical protein VMT99_01260 [Candidatus Paceibacterota bacterium]|nr:hypothetical protein [Candidatus Paceibacterota bacterium]
MFEDDNRVQQGMRYLSERYGGREWVERIDVQRLNIACTENCVIGQLEGDYNEARGRFNFGDSKMCDLGLLVLGEQRSPQVLAAYDILTIDWRRAIFRQRMELMQERAANRAMPVAVREEESVEDLVCV